MKVVLGNESSGCAAGCGWIWMMYCDYRSCDLFSSVPCEGTLQIYIYPVFVQGNSKVNQYIKKA